MDIDFTIKPKLLLLMKYWNKRITLQHAYYHYTKIRNEEIRKKEIDWIKLLFNLYPNLELAYYYAITVHYFLIIKEDFLKNENKLKEWYNGHFDVIIHEDVLPKIYFYYFKIYGVNSL